MITAVEDRHLEVHNRITRQIAARRRLDDALLNRRNKLPWNRAAEHFVGELETTAARRRLHPDLAVAELAVSATLLFVASMSFGAATNALAIRHLRRFQCHLGVVPLLQTRHNRLDVRLSGPGNQKLIGLRIAEEANQQILFHQLVNSRRKLVLVRAALRLDSIGHRGLRQSSQFNLNLCAFLAQRVSGKCFAQFRHCPKIAGMQLHHFHSFASLHHTQMRKTFLAASRVVLQCGVVSHHSTDHLEERDAPRKWVRHSLEHQQRSRLAVADFSH